jgi:hypothetical protein
MDQGCTKVTEYKVCSDPSFGLAGWANEEVLNGTSGWRDGGYNSDAYCTDFTNSAAAAPTKAFLKSTVGETFESVDLRRLGVQSRRFLERADCESLRL